MFKDAKTTDVAHVFSLVRVNVSRAGTPARNVRRDGLEARIRDGHVGFLPVFGTLHAGVPRRSPLFPAHAMCRRTVRRPSRSRSARTEKLPSVTTTSPSLDARDHRYLVAGSGTQPHFALDERPGLPRVDEIHHRPIADVLHRRAGTIGIGAPPPLPKNASAYMPRRRSPRGFGTSIRTLAVRVSGLTCGSM